MRGALSVYGAALLVGCGASPGTSSHTKDAGAAKDATSELPSVTIPLSGCPLDSYFAPVTIAGQAFTLLLDTGSSDVAVALSTCSTCDVSPKLSPPSGSCSTQLATQQYLGWVGGVCSESISVGGEIPDVTMNVVGISENTEFFTDMDCMQHAIDGQPRYQGILGIGPPSLATVGQSSDDAYVTELAAHGVAEELALLLCSVGGKMWFGGYDPAFAKGSPEYTPLSASMGWSIAVSSIGLGAANLGEGASQTIVDTGTQYYSVPSSVFQAFMSQQNPGLSTIFGAQTLGSIFDKTSCVAPIGVATQTEIDTALPPMTLTLPSASGGSFTLSLPATSSYLVPATPAGGGPLEYCMAIRDSATTDGYALLGGPILRSNITIFDVAHARLGFVAQTFCH